METKNCVCASFNSEVSYAQGMNDLCSRFLEVLDSEVDTFWSFSCYMEKFSKDFRADGLRRKIGKDAYSKTHSTWTMKKAQYTLHKHLLWKCTRKHFLMYVIVCVLPFRVGGRPVEGTGSSALWTFSHRQHGKLCLLPQVPGFKCLLVFPLCVNMKYARWSGD